MKIKVRKAGIYQDVRIEDGQTIIDFGLLDEAERKNLAAIFIEAASELLAGLEDDSEQVEMEKTP